MNIFDQPYRQYGESLSEVVLVHGGPGAPGELGPLAEKLSHTFSVLEPFQTKSTIDGQVEELAQIIGEHTKVPITLVGWSWGAWLSYIFASKYPEQVKKLILVSSGPFDEKYKGDLIETRLGRLTEDESRLFTDLINSFSDQKDKVSSIKKIASLAYKADNYAPLEQESSFLDCPFEIFEKVSQEASALRSSGKLLELGAQIKCPVVAIQGDYDPHPSLGVKEPLSRVLQDFKFIEIEKCGHHPWLEKYAKDTFLETLVQELH